VMVVQLGDLAVPQRSSGLSMSAADRRRPCMARGALAQSGVIELMRGLIPF
jgi:hypothetical protein